MEEYSYFSENSFKQYLIMFVFGGTYDMVWKNSIHSKLQKNGYVEMLSYKYLDEENISILFLNDSEEIDSITFNINNLKNQYKPEKLEGVQMDYRTIISDALKRKREEDKLYNDEVNRLLNNKGE